MKHADPSQDGHQSPPVFPPVSAGGSCRALQSSAGSGTRGAESFRSTATPWVMPVLRDVLVWVQFSLGGGLGQEQNLRLGRVTGKPTQKGSKWRELRAAMPLRKDTEVCASLRRLLGSHKSPSPSPSMPSPGLWRPAAAAGCAGTPFPRRGGTLPCALARRGCVEGMGGCSPWPLRVLPAHCPPLCHRLRGPR